MRSCRRSAAKKCPEKWLSSKATKKAPRLPTWLFNLADSFIRYLQQSMQIRTHRSAKEITVFFYTSLDMFMMGKSSDRGMHPRSGQFPFERHFEKSNFLRSLMWSVPIESTVVNKPRWNPGIQNGLTAKRSSGERARTTGGLRLRTRKCFSL